ncbi:hypothetical protein J2772_000344 [Chryseobacterium jejuense]|nr:hypothetical protein [Chryseobacterium jejuense]
MKNNGYFDLKKLMIEQVDKTLEILYKDRIRDLYIVS